MKKTKITLVALTMMISSCATNNKPNDIISSHEEGNSPNPDAGYCDVSFTVSKTGSIKDIEVDYCTDEMFKPSAIKAATQRYYDPLIVEGEAVDSDRVGVRVAFQIDKAKAIK